MYRPKDWKNPYSMTKREERLHLYDVEPRNAYEAGADAMLEGLKKEGWKITGESVIEAQGGFPEIHLPPPPDALKGWLVFIPEDTNR